MAGFDFYIRTKQDMIDAVNTFGIVPFFRNSVLGFSLEEHAAPETWYSSDHEWAVWEWKGPVIRETGCAYGKFFEKKAAFVSAELFRDLANYRRDGYDFDARYDDGLASRRDLELYELIEKNAPVLSKTLKAMGDYRKGGRTGFETSVTRLQRQCYVVISDFVYALDRYGQPYGWGAAEYSTPEKLFGENFTAKVYSRSPGESGEIVAARLRALLPDADEKRIQKFLDS